MKNLLSLIIVAILMSGCSTASKAYLSEIQTPLSIGVFDETRGGDFNFADSRMQEFLLQDLLMSFPNLTFIRTHVLDETFFETVDIVLLSSAKGNLRATSALSEAEQAALRQFIERGGGGVIFAENDSFGGADSDAINETFLDPFELDVTATFEDRQALTTSALDNPISNGVFGIAAAATCLFPGYFDALGPYAQSVATLEINNEPALAYILRDSFNPGSGGIVFFSDVNITAETLNAGASLLIRNAVAYAAGF